MPQWHIDYFELKFFETQLVGKKMILKNTLTPPLTPWMREPLLGLQMTRKRLSWRLTVKIWQERYLRLFPLKLISLRLNSVLGRKASQSLFEHFMQTFQRHTAFNLEAPVHRNLFISALMGNCLPDIRKQIHNNVVGWSRPPLIVIMEAGARFFENTFQECRKKN